MKEKTPGPRKPPDHTDEDCLIGVPNPIAGPSTCAFAYGTIGQLGAAQAPERGRMWRLGVPEAGEPWKDAQQAP